MVGCKTRTGLTFNEDGTGTFQSSLEMTKREIALLGDRGDPIEALVANAENVSFPVDVEQTEVGNTKGFSASFEFSDVDDLKAKLTELNQDAESSSTLFRDAEITSGDDGWTFEAQSGGPDTAAAEEFIDPEEIETLIDAQVRVTLPGDEAQNNATMVQAAEESTTFVWDLNPGADTNLEAVTVFPESLLDKIGGPAVLVVAVVVLLLAAVVVMRRRKASSPSQS